MQTILRTDNITKKYKDFTAVDKLNISVDKGDVYGFIGQNGAGKTTTIRLLLNLLKPTDGYIELFGESITKSNAHKVLRRIGSIIEIPGFYLNLTGWENLNLHRIMMGVSDKSEIERALKTVCLQDAGNKKVRHYSLGMKQRLGIARALLHNPELLILDEPTNGLDPKGIVEVRDLIINIAREQGKTILISSHILSEVEKMVNMVGIIHKGKLIEEINQEEIQNKYKKIAIFKVSDIKKSIELINQKLNISDVEVKDDGFNISVQDENVSGLVTKLLVDNNITVSESKLITTTLEEYFIKLTEGETA